MHYAAVTMATKAIGPRIRELRKARKWTQQELASRMGGGVNATQISNWETGRWKSLTMPNVERLARAFGISVAEFVDSTNVKDLQNDASSGLRSSPDTAAPSVNSLTPSADSPIVEAERGGRNVTPSERLDAACKLVLDEHLEEAGYMLAEWAIARRRLRHGNSGSGSG